MFNFKDKKKSLRIKYRPLLSLRSLLDEYLAIGDVIRSETSSSLFYFLEFLDQEGSLSLIRFWLSATKLRKIYSQWTAPTSLENSEKIQEEIQKIYKAYSTGTFYGLNDALKAIEIFSLTQLSENLREACLAIFKCQSVVFDDLQIYFNQFLDSDHYFRLATELQRGDGSNDNNSSSSNSTLLRTERLSSSQNSIILSQLEVSLERESLRLTGSKNYKDKETLDVSDPLLFNSIEEVLDVEALESNIFDENQNESQVFSGLDFQTSELLHSSTKLQQIKEDLDRNQQQMDILDTLLQKYHYADNNTPSPVQMMQIHILEQSQALVRQEMNDLSLDKVKYQTQEQKEAIVPVILILIIN